MRIFKYELLVTDRQTIKLPIGAKILSVQMQKEVGTDISRLLLWAEVDLEFKLEERRIAIFGTGSELPSCDLRHISTVITESGLLVWHVYEILSSSRDKPSISPDFSDFS